MRLKMNAATHTEHEAMKTTDAAIARPVHNHTHSWKFDADCPTCVERAANPEHRAVKISLYVRLHCTGNFVGWAWGENASDAAHRTRGVRTVKLTPKLTRQIVTANERQPQIAADLRKVIARAVQHTVEHANHVIPSRAVVYHATFADTATHTLDAMNVPQLPAPAPVLDTNAAAWEAWLAR